MYKFLLCSRYLTTRYIALASVVSVMLGVATMIIVNAVMLGFGEKMRERLHGVLADVVIESTTLDGFPEPRAVMDRIDEVCGDKIVAMTPAIEVFAMLNFQNQGRGAHMTRPIKLLGIDPKGRAKVGEFSKYLQNADNQKEPSFALRPDGQKWRDDHIDILNPDFATPAGCVLGYQIATFRGKGMDHDQSIIQPGQEVIVTTVTAGRPKPVDDRFVVVDLYKCDMSEYDSNYVFVPYERLQEVRGMGDAATAIQITLKNYADAPAVVEKLQKAFPRVYYHVQTWEDKQGPLLLAVKVERFILNLILFFIVAVAGFGILAIFTMIVVEKTRDIGILKSLGASDRGIMHVFLMYGLSLGLIGCILGTSLGVSFTLNINAIEHWLANWTGLEIFPRDIYYFKDIPVLLHSSTVAWINVGAMFIGVVAAVFPALRAARLRPVEALRYAA